MKAQKNGRGFTADLASPQALDAFRKAAQEFTSRATRSREIARQTLIDEGIYTKSGKLAKQYR